MRIFRFIYIAVASFVLLYMSVTLSGIFFISAPDFRAVLYSMPLNVCSFVILLSMTVELFLGSAQSGRAGITGWIALAAAMLLCAGFWVGGLMGYSMRTVITEGQTVTLPAGAARGLGGYTSKYAKPLQVKITLKELLPEFNSMGNRLDGLEARLSVARDGAQSVKVSVKKGISINPFAVDINIDDFGYSPRYEMRDVRGVMIDSSFVFLKLFPPGSEDHFRLLAPLTYYLRYYPQGDMTTDDEHPYFNIRIARNRDLVFNEKVAPGEMFIYENARMSFPEIRQWTVLEVRANPGAPLVWLGVIAALTALVLMYRSRRRVK